MMMMGKMSPLCGVCGMLTTVKTDSAKLTGPDGGTAPQITAVVWDKFSLFANVEPAPLMRWRLHLAG
jgi:hypothetical protein